jgi:hypothetical protein
MDDSDMAKVVEIILQNHNPFDVDSVSLTLCQYNLWTSGVACSCEQPCRIPGFGQTKTVRELGKESG